MYSLYSLGFPSPLSCAFFTDKDSLRQAHICFSQVDAAKEKLRNLEDAPGIVVRALKASAQQPIAPPTHLLTLISTPEVHATRPDVTRWVAHVVRNFSVRNAWFGKRLIVAGAIEAILKGLEAHGSRHEKLAEFCFAALSFVVGSDSRHRLPLRAMGVYVEVMRAQGPSSHVAHYGCLAIAYALEAGGEVKAEAEEEAIQGECRLEDAGIYVNGEEASTPRFLAQSLLDAGGFEVIIRAWHLHAESSSEVVRWSSTALLRCLASLRISSWEGLEEVTTCLSIDPGSGLHQLRGNLEAGGRHRNKKARQAALALAELLPLGPAAKPASEERA